MASMVSMDRGTQTDEENSSPERLDRGRSSREKVEKITQHVEDSDEAEAEEAPMKEVTTSPIRMNSNDQEMDHSTEAIPDYEPEKAPQPAPVLAKARVVTIPKRVPPSLPPRNPGRLSSPLAESNPEAMESLKRISTDEARDALLEAKGVPLVNGDDHTDATDSFAPKDPPSEPGNENVHLDTEAERDGASSVYSKDLNAGSGKEPNEDEFHSIPVSPVEDGQHAGGSMPGGF